MTYIEKSLNSKMEDLELKALEASKVGDGAWKMPFVIVVVIVLGGAVGLWMFYEKMRKMHLL